MQNTPNLRQIDELHSALLRIVFQFNDPNRDDILIKAAGINLDKALFPLLIGIDRFGPVGIVELANMVGRDYTTVSRQVGKLVALQLVIRQQDSQDKRIHNALISPQGKEMTAKIDQTRYQFYQQMFNQWNDDEIGDFKRLIEKFSTALTQFETP
ncbi:MULTISPECIES: MarR family winged helix-turn-helix transcriptional regulator [Providencia]|uniref:MarR family winged helix-turn-helix transcriptional regulator n=1 Tax=Providencia TaxID=586 RepID=UPI00235ECE42|nr:MarR family winged helix-turn-helix transcriptional regulator [Providencia rettgeri]ELR5151074.1 winged helix-turn-helix transcriptional regulator [Providencia rettgeri]